MDHDTLLQFHLDKLDVPSTGSYRLDHAKPYRDRVSGRQRPGFETRAACCAEDIRRAQMIKALPKEVHDGIFQCDPQEIINILEESGNNKFVTNHPASAFYMRNRRLALLGAVLKLFHENIHGDFGFFRITHPEWRFGLREQWSPPDYEEETSFHRLLSLVRIWDFPGFLIGHLGGIYDPEEDKIELAWSGVCGGIMLRAFKILLSVEESDAGIRDIHRLYLGFDATTA